MENGAKRVENLYSLSDEGSVTETIDRRFCSDFCGVEASNQVSKGDILGRFRNLKIYNGIQKKMFAQVVEAATGAEPAVEERHQREIDAYFSSASTKNRKTKRDLEAYLVKREMDSTLIIKQM